MPDQKISQLSDGGAAQATDEYVVARSGANYRIDGASVAAAATSVGTLSSLTVSGDLTVDTSTLKVDSTGNYVGIGLSNPSARLHVSDATAADGTIWLGNNAANQGRIKYDGATNGQFVFENRYDSANAASGYVFKTRTASTAIDALQIGGDGTIDLISDEKYVNLYSDATVGFNARARFRAVASGGGAGYGGDFRVSTRKADNNWNDDAMTLDASGNLGLGVTPSAWSGFGLPVLELPSGGTIVSAGNGSTIGSNWYYSGGQFLYKTSLAASYYFQNGGAHSWHTAPSGTAGNPITFTQAMTLDVNGGLVTDGGTGRGRFTFENGSATNVLYSTTTSFGAYNTLRLQASDIQFYAGSSPAERARIDASGNLGVGTASPGNGVEIAVGSKASAGLLVTGSNSPRILVTSTGTTVTGGAVADDAAIYLGTTTNHPTVLRTNNTERARITSGGYFKASNDGTYAGIAAGYHELRQTATNSNIVSLTNSSASPYGPVMAFTVASPDNNTNYFLACDDSTTTRCYIWSDGDLANHDGVYGTISDERLKQDIVDAGSAWNDLKAVRFRKYRMKTDVEANPDAPAMLGVIAQELEQVMPGLVDEHPEFKEQEVTDEDGNVTTERVQVGTTKTVKSSILLMKAAVALQEAMARIEALEARLEALEA